MAITIELLKSRIGSEVNANGLSIGYTEHRITLDNADQDPLAIIMGTTVPIIAGAVPPGSSHPWASLGSVKASRYAIAERKSPRYITIRVTYDPVTSLIANGWSFIVQSSNEMRKIYRDLNQTLIGSLSYADPIGPNTVGLPPTPPSEVRFFVTTESGGIRYLRSTAARVIEGYDIPAGGSLLVLRKTLALGIKPWQIGAVAAMRGSCNEGRFGQWSSTQGQVLFKDYTVDTSSGGEQTQPTPGTSLPVVVTLYMQIHATRHTPIKRGHQIPSPDGDGSQLPVLNLEDSTPVIEDFPVIPLIDLEGLFAILNSP